MIYPINNENYMLNKSVVLENLDQLSREKAPLKSIKAL